MYVYVYISANTVTISALYSYMLLDEQAGASCIHWMQIRTQCYSGQRHVALHTVHSLITVFTWTYVKWVQPGSTNPG